MPGIDTALFHLINNFAGQSRLLDFLGIFFAEYLTYIIVVGLVMLLVGESSWRERWYNASLLALAALLSRGVILPIIRFFYDRPRPFITFPEITTLIAKNAAEPSFPSGHMAIFMALAVCLYYMSPRYRKWFYYALAATVVMGIARVFVGVHYPVDIAGGMLVGWFAAFITERYVLPNMRAKTVQPNP